METQEVTNESAELSDAEMDALVNQEPMSNTEIPMQESQPQQEEAKQWTLDINGKQVTADEAKLQKWAQMGYDYAQKMAEFKQQQEQWQDKTKTVEQQIQEYEQKFSPYLEIDKYASENPDWWQKVQESYQQQKEVQENPEIAQLKNELQELKQFREEIMVEKQNQVRAQEDNQLAQEVKSIREQYSNLDWDSPNEEGKNLEWQVLEHAQKNGISNFRAAFRDFNHDRLMSLAQDRAKEAVVADTRAKTKLGLLGETKAPVGIQNASNLTEKSYEDLAREALEEISKL